MKKVQFEGKCPICLFELSDPSLLHPCLHEFCLSCISQWLEIVPTCPLCKKRVTNLIYDIQSENEYKSVPFPPNPNSKDSTKSFGGKIPKEENESRIRFPPTHPFRKYIYFRYASPIPFVSPNVKFSKAYYLQHKSRMEEPMRVFVRRELETILQSHSVEYMTEYVLSMLEKCEIDDADESKKPFQRKEFDGAVSKFVKNENSRALFIHEIVSFGRCLRSGVSMNRFDELELKKLKEEERKKSKGPNSMVDE